LNRRILRGGKRKGKINADPSSDILRVQRGVAAGREGGRRSGAAFELCEGRVLAE